MLETLEHAFLRTKFPTHDTARSRPSTYMYVHTCLYVYVRGPCQYTPTVYHRSLCISLSEADWHGQPTVALQIAKIILLCDVKHKSRKHIIRTCLYIYPYIHTESFLHIRTSTHIDIYTDCFCRCMCIWKCMGVCAV